MFYENATKMLLICIQTKFYEILALCREKRYNEAEFSLKGSTAMIDTIMFDLDGTLLHFSQKDFIGAYFSELTKVFIRLGFDAPKSIEALWVGTKAMVLNDGSVFNTERFWKGFAKHLGLSDEKLAEAEAACDLFYVNEFNNVKSVLSPNEIPKKLVRKMKEKGYGIVLATNPLFPECAVESRLAWSGLDMQDFILVTHYSNSTFCKPNPGYFREIFSKINKTPEECLMAGNNPAEDMIAGELGSEVFLVTDCLENEAGVDISAFRNGTLSELEAYLISMPDIV